MASIRGNFSSDEEGMDNPGGSQCDEGNRLEYLSNSSVLSEGENGQIWVEDGVGKSFLSPTPQPGPCSRVTYSPPRKVRRFMMVCGDSERRGEESVNENSHR